MSHTTVKAVWPGEKTEDLVQLNNSWGSAPVIWDFLTQKYLGKPPCSYLQNRTELWLLWRSQRIPVSYRAVHMLTFDRAYVLKKDYGRMASDIRAFLSAHPNEPGVNHWPELAKLFDSNPEIPALGLWCTSVSDDPFAGPYSEEKEHYEGLDWTTAYDLYAELDSLPIKEEVHAK